MKFTPKQEKVFDFMKECHSDQVRKYTGEPYHVHLFNVAKIVSIYDPLLIEIALCHDVLEDTQCSVSLLIKELVNMGYSPQGTKFILEGVRDLTDKYTKEDYPLLNRASRKKLERERMATIQPSSQTVKYADIIDNTLSIVAYDHDFSSVFLPECLLAVEGMTKGKLELMGSCSMLLRSCLLILKQGKDLL